MIDRVSTLRKIDMIVVLVLVGEDPIEIHLQMEVVVMISVISSKIVSKLIVVVG